MESLDGLEVFCIGEIDQEGGFSVRKGAINWMLAIGSIHSVVCEGLAVKPSNMVLGDPTKMQYFLLDGTGGVYKAALQTQDEDSKVLRLLPVTEKEGDWVRTQYLALQGR
jgi:hypothetical protein